MSLFDHPDDLKLLQDLLTPKNRNGSDLESDEDEVAVARRQKLTPATIAQQEDVKKDKKNARKTPYEKLEDKAPENIEEWQKMQEEQDAELLETRKAPSYNITYRQAVGTQDVFFQMNNRTNGSASCEDMIVEISLPEENIPAEKMNLTITQERVTLSTPVYCLKLPFPHPVNVDRSNAKYDPESKKLTLTLRMKRELDFVNF